MNEEDEGTTAPFTEATRARLVLSAEAAYLSDVARAFVAIGDHELNPDGTASSTGSWVSEADHVVSAAQRVLDAAVVFTRLAGSSWPSIGIELDVTRQSAEERFGAKVKQFRDDLHSPENPDYTGEFGQLRWRIHPAAADPEQAARNLDEWLRDRYSPALDSELGEAPVSGGLTRMDPHAELAWISERHHQMWKTVDRGASVPMAERLALAERELRAWEQIAAGEPRSRRTTTHALDRARQAVAELRAQYAEQRH